MFITDSVGPTFLVAVILCYCISVPCQKRTLRLVVSTRTNSTYRCRPLINTHTQQLSDPRSPVAVESPSKSSESAERLHLFVFAVWSTPNT